MAVRRRDGSIIGPLPVGGQVRGRGGERVETPSPQAPAPGQVLPAAPVTEGPSALEALAGGTLTGLRRNPILKPVVDKIANTFGADEATLTRLEQRLSRSRLADVGEIVGEFGPDFALATVGFVAGGGAAVAGARAAQLGLKGARAAQIAGRSAGTGAFEFTRSMAAGEELEQAAKHAAIGAALVGGIEVGVTGAGRLLSRRARESSSVIEERLRQRPEFQRAQKALDKDIAKSGKKIRKMKDRIQKTLATAEQEQELLRIQVRDPGAQKVIRFGSEIDVTKPQGAFTTPAAFGASSPHAELGRKFEAFINPKAKVLEVDTSQLIRSPRGGFGDGLVGKSTNIAALEKFVGVDEVQRLLFSDKNALIQKLSKEFPAVQWSRFHDTTELLEGYAGMLARKRGFDVIVGPDKLAPQFSEVVGLTKKAFAAPAKVTTRSSFIGPQEAFTRGEATAAKVEKQLVKLRQLTSERRALRSLKEDPTAWFTRDTPFNPDGARLILSRFAQQTIRSPESFQGEFGIAFGRFFQKWRKSEDLSILSEDLNEFFVKDLAKRAQGALGLSTRKAGKGRGFLPALTAWEEGGEAGVRQYMQSIGRGNKADDIVSVFSEAKAAMSKNYRQLHQLGAEPFADLPKVGLREFWPHVAASIPEGEFTARLAKRVGEKRAADIMDTIQKEGLSRFGSVDAQRVMPGSLAAKIADDLPFDSNPFNGLLRYMNAVSRRTVYGREFGFNTKVAKEAIVGAVRKEGGSLPLVNSLTDFALGHRYYEQAMRDVSRTFTGLQTASKLTLAVIPNLSQGINTVLDQGIRANTKALLLLAKPWNRDEIIKAVALQNSVTKGMNRIFGEARIGSAIESTGGVNRLVGRLGNAADKSAYWTLRYSGFSLTEKWNRVMGGAAALSRFRLDLHRAANGRLRGQARERARRSWRDLGFDLDEIAGEASRRGDDFYKTARFQEIEKLFTFRGAQRSQFLPSGTRRPLFWNDPVGRVVFQFKSFAFNQGRFIRDRVLTEAALGNVRPLAYFASIYPIAGEFVTNAREIVKNQELVDKEGLPRVLGDVMAVGGIGLIGDTFVQARWGRLAEAGLGPTVGGGLALAENIAQGDGSEILAGLLRQPLAQAMEFLAAAALLTAEQGRDLVEQLGDEEPTGRTTVDLGTLRERRILEKTR